MSGSVDAYTGFANGGSSGYFAINTGPSNSGSGGDIDIMVSRVCACVFTVQRGKFLPLFRLGQEIQVLAVTSTW